MCQSADSDRSQGAGTAEKAEPAEGGMNMLVYVWRRKPAGGTRFLCRRDCSPERAGAMAGHGSSCGAPQVSQKPYLFSAFSALSAVN